ncbi:hypothetical protein FJQ54_10425 [Sandaracinobacter neustonicus]|uniref:Uncharacterized protein n=1 Tax=Sandaracinobacter neustonicus TaxID=1715348 RepID=A0A501XJT1_9SPHN|nr:hypothetical protein [Sandaracinobacter neustonicus]TPE60427.1 hypothetical protein FJQ54_10425 [Sandaracinobacter neustonicus]
MKANYCFVLECWLNCNGIATRKATGNSPCWNTLRVNANNVSDGAASTASSSAWLERLEFIDRLVGNISLLKLGPSKGLRSQPYILVTTAKLPLKALLNQ